MNSSRARVSPSPSPSPLPASPPPSPPHSDTASESDQEEVNELHPDYDLYQQKEDGLSDEVSESEEAVEAVVVADVDDDETKERAKSEPPGADSFSDGPQKPAKRQHT